MDGFLVLGQCGMDNVPMRFVPSHSLALVIANTTTREQVIAVANRVLEVDVSIVVGVAIVPFQGGVSQEMEYVRDIDGDNEEEVDPDLIPF